MLHSVWCCRYKPPSTDTNPTLEDPTPDYMNLLGMIFSMCGLMLKVTYTHTFTHYTTSVAPTSVYVCVFVSPHTEGALPLNGRP